MTAVDLRLGDVVCASAAAGRGFDGAMVLRTTVDAVCDTPILMTVERKMMAELLATPSPPSPHPRLSHPWMRDRHF